MADEEKYKAVSLGIDNKLDSFAEREAKPKRALDALCLRNLANLSVSLTVGGFGIWY